MTRVELVRQADRSVEAERILRAWDEGHATWVVDPVASVDPLADLVDAWVGPEAVERLVTSGAATVDLDVPDDTATIVTSSGTTGTPKVLPLAAAALDASADGAHAHLGVTDRDRWLLALPLHHVAGQSVLWRSRRLGTTAVVQHRLDVHAAAAAGVTVASLVPTQLRRMVDAGFRLDATVLLGGGAISPRLLDDVAAGGHVRRVVRSYGLTETAGGCVYDGVAFPGVEVAAPTGRLQIRGPVLAAGQLGPTGLVPITDDEGWLVTNDLGAVDDGIVSVVGRVDDVVVTGGVNVAPAAVEVVLEDDPAVSRAGVVGLHDEQWGQRVVAAVVPHGGRTPQVDALRERVRDQLGAAAVPKEVRIVADLPLSALGKVQRDRLHDRLAPPAG